MMANLSDTLGVGEFPTAFAFFIRQTTPALFVKVMRLLKCRQQCLTGSLLPVSSFRSWSVRAKHSSSLCNLRAASEVGAQVIGGK
jgi:hypothetical protein